MTHFCDRHPSHYDARRADILDAPRLVLQAVFAVLVHARAEVERKVWAEPRPLPMPTPPGHGPVVHEYRYSCWPPMPSQDRRFR